MSSSLRPRSIAAIAEQILGGYPPGMAVKDFLHEFQEGGNESFLLAKPARLMNRVNNGEMLDAYLQALAVYLAVKLDRNPPEWTHPAIQLKDPWFATPGAAMRNYLLISSPASFRSRNLFIDEDSLTVA